MAKPLGRPPKWKNIDREQLRKLASRGYTIEGLADFFKVHRNTLSKHFSAEIEDAKHMGCTKIMDEFWRRGFGLNTKASDRIFLKLADRMLGPVVQKTELTGKDGSPISTHPAVQVVVTVPSNGRESKD